MQGKPGIGFHRTPVAKRLALKGVEQMSKTGFKGRALAALSAVALLAAMAPGAALAEPGSRYTSDITINGVDSGATITAYEIVDAIVDSNNQLSYTYANGVDENTYKNLTSNSTEMKAAVGTIATGIADGSVTPIDTQTKIAAGGSVVFSNLDDGAWLFVVTNANGSTKVYQNTVVNNTPKIDGLNYAANPQIAGVKSDDGPTPDKTVGTGNDHSTSAYQIGDSVPFTITAAIPNYPSNYANPTFTISDAPNAGLIDDVSSIAVQANGVDVANVPANYAATASGNGFKLAFTADFIKSHLGQTITVKYSAKLTSDAFKIVGDGTKNSMTLEYSNSPDTTHSSDPVKDDVNTYGFYFQKVDGSNNALAGAEFTLYNADGSAPIVDENGQPLKSTADANGYVWFEDLADGKTYTLKETKVPAGKQAVADFTVTIDKAKATLDNPATNGVTEANYQKYTDANTVTDPDQSLLPVTGGPGTLALTVAGVILMAGGAAVVVRSRKRSE